MLHMYWCDECHRRCYRRKNAYGPVYDTNACRQRAWQRAFREKRGVSYRTWRVRMGYAKYVNRKLVTIKSLRRKTRARKAA